MQVWKEVQDFKDYQISNTGIIKSLLTTKETILSPVLTKKGYLRVGIYNNNKEQVFKSIHRLVGTAFIPNPENKPYINHKDGVKTNNNDWNLEWATYRENVDHAIKNGLSSCGERNGNSTLKENEVIYIYNCLRMGINVNVLIDKFNVSRSTIMGIKTGTHWKILKLVPLEESRASSVTLSQIYEIENLLRNYNIREINRLTGYSRQLITKIKTNEYEQLKYKLEEILNYQ